MQTVTIELTNDKAMGLLKQLEQMKVLRLVGTQRKATTKKRKWRGAISKTSAEQMLQSNQKARDEWERDF